MIPTLKIKPLIENCNLPRFTAAGSAGLDVPAAEDVVIFSGKRALIPCGFATEFAQMFVALLRDRSGLAAKHGLHVLAGVIDSDYRGEWKVCLLNTGDTVYHVKRGDYIAQAIFVNRVQPTIVVVNELSDSHRGTRGFTSGSSQGSVPIVNSRC